MESPPRDAVERFLRRTAGTSRAVLHRNLEANVYGPPGSSARAIAEDAVRRRTADVAGAAEVARVDQLESVYRELERVRRSARTAKRVALVASLIAAFALVYALGWI